VPNGSLNWGGDGGAPHLGANPGIGLSSSRVVETSELQPTQHS